MQELKPIINKPKYERMILKALQQFFISVLFRPIIKIVKPIGELHNAKETPLIKALREGKIQYIDGKFYGKFNAAISRELISMGAKFNKITKTYNLTRDKLPMEVIGAMAQGAILAQTIRQELLNFLKSFSIEKFMPEMKALLDVPLDEIVEDIDEQAETAIKEVLKIVPDFKQEERETLKREYIENVEYSVKNFTSKEVNKLREMVEYNLYYGYNKNSSLIDRIQKEFNITYNRAKFIARQETNLLTSHLAEMRLKSAGINHYKWQTSHDERVRDSHKDLDGKIFSWDNPPIVNKKGDRKNPGEDFNCYAKDTEVLTNNGFKYIKDVEIGETIATLNPVTKQFEWSKCTNKIFKKVDEIVTLQSSIFKLKCSLDHNFFYYKKKYDGKKQIKGSDYPVFSQGLSSLAKKNTFFYGGSEWIGTKQNTIAGLPVEIFCKFMGYYLSDGNVDKRTKNCIHIAQTNNDWMFNQLKDYLHIRQGKEKLYIYNEELFKIVEPLGFCNKK